MIQANELRIGNWVTEFTTAYPNGKDIQLTFISEEDDFENCRGILLTPEILEKCGFSYKKPGAIGGQDEWAGMGFWYPKQTGFNHSVYFRGNNGKNITLRLVGHFNTQLLFLHQLQNLYFALTGEELEYKP